jgi:peroxiredoxin
MRMILKINLHLLLIICCIVFMHQPVMAGSNPPEKGEMLPDFTLAVPDNPGYRGYLGLSKGNNTFKIPEIKATVVIIEIFSMYCPHCQRDAPNVNSFFNMIENNSGLKGKIKIIGIGAGNSSFEIDIFRKKYNVLFPLFPDNDFAVHKRIGEVRTPYFIALKINGDGSHKVIYSKLGGIEKADQFLELMIRLSELDKGGGK